jgi:hypothetical protein
MAQAPGPLAIATAPNLPGGAAGAYYALALAGSGGTAPYSNWTISTGSLPPGLAVNAATGVISGIPTTTAGSPFAFSMTVQDNVGNTSPVKNFEIAVGPFATIPGQSEVLNSPRLAAAEPLLFPYAAGGGPEFWSRHRNYDFKYFGGHAGQHGAERHLPAELLRRTARSRLRPRLRSPPDSSWSSMYRPAAAALRPLPAFQRLHYCQLRVPAGARVGQNFPARNRKHHRSCASAHSPRNVPASQDFLIPFATNEAGFDTAISIANTSADPFGASGGDPDCGHMHAAFLRVKRAFGVIYDARHFSGDGSILHRGALCHSSRIPGLRNGAMQFRRGLGFQLPGGLSRPILRLDYAGDRRSSPQFRYAAAFVFLGQQSKR